MRKAVVLSSGGLDSTTCLSLAVDKYGSENVTSVSVVYGQRHIKELDCSKKIAQYYSVPHMIIDLSTCGIFDNSNCALLSNSTQNINAGSYAEQINNSNDGVVNTYVPFRNGLILSAVASFAMSTYANDEIDIYLGIHSDDSAHNAYADCSPQFLHYMREAILIGTYNKVNVVAPFVNLTKADVVKIGIELNTPYELTWSCYTGGDTPCGKCATCIDRARAFELNGINDPALDRR